jgi:hypothetical protein
MGADMNLRSALTRAVDPVNELGEADQSGLSAMSHNKSNRYSEERHRGHFARDGDCKNLRLPLILIR